MHPLKSSNTHPQQQTFCEGDTTHVVPSKDLKNSPRISWISNLTQSEEHCSETVSVVSGKQLQAMAAVEMILLGSLWWRFHSVVFPQCLLWPELPPLLLRASSRSYMGVEKLPGPSGLTVLGFRFPPHPTHPTNKPTARSGWPTCYQTCSLSLLSPPSNWMFPSLVEEDVYNRSIPRRRVMMTPS